MSMNHSLQLDTVGPPKMVSRDKDPKIVHSFELLYDTENLYNWLPDLSIGFRAEEDSWLQQVYLLIESCIVYFQYPLESQCIPNWCLTHQEAIIGEEEMQNRKYTRS